MERQIGEVFTYEGKTYQIIPREKEDCCTGCAFDLGLYACKKPRNEARNNFGYCYFRFRKDKKGIIFKEINNMENNQLNIEIPEGMEIDLENTNLTKGIIKFKQKGITYNYIFDILKNKYNVQSSLVAASSNNKIKLSCLDKLLDIAKYYNQCWEPNWNNTNEYKFSIIYDHGLKRYVISKTTTKIETCVYFKNYDDVSSVINNPNFKELLDSIYKQ